MKSLEYLENMINSTTECERSYWVLEGYQTIKEDLEELIILKDKITELENENKELKRKAQCCDLLFLKGRCITYKGKHYVINKIYVEDNRIEITEKFRNPIIVELDDLLKEVLEC